MATEVGTMGAKILRIRKQMEVYDRGSGSDGKIAGRTAPFER
jgi:hypothetical protein